MTTVGTDSTASAVKGEEHGSTAQRERRRRILDATIALATDGGFDAVQMRAVAERAQFHFSMRRGRRKPVKKSRKNKKSGQRSGPGCRNGPSQRAGNCLDTLCRAAPN